MGRAVAIVSDFSPEEIRSWPIFSVNPRHTQRLAEEALQVNRVVLFRAGNRAGKSDTMVRVCTKALLGCYSWCRPPAHVVIVALSQKQAAGALQEKIDKYILSLPYPAVIESKTTRENLTACVKLTNGSFLEVLTVAQGWLRLQGRGVNLWGFDEQPHEPMWKEARRRLKPGASMRFFFAMTPTLGKSWVYDKIYRKCLEPGSGYVEFSGSPYENGDPPCLTCGRDREWWDKRLPELSIRRGSDDAGRPELGGCPRCYTYGVEPVYSEEEIRNFSEGDTATERSVHLWGEFAQIEGAQFLKDIEIEKLRADQQLGSRTGCTTIWKQAESGHPYVMGVDAADGLASENLPGNNPHDETVATVLDAATGEQVATFADDSTPPHVAVQDIMELVELYNPHSICVENMGAGQVVLTELQRRPGVRLYRHRHPNRHYQPVTAGTKLGWTPSRNGRDLLLRNLRDAIRRRIETNDGARKANNLGTITVRDEKTVAQLGIFYHNEDKGRIEIPRRQGYHDDRVFALALAHEARQENSYSVRNMEPPLQAPPFSLAGLGLAPAAEARIPRRLLDLARRMKRQYILTGEMPR